MKVLVVYYSETSNTEKVAVGIHEEASKEHAAHLKKLSDVEAKDLEDYDFVFLGSPCHDSDVAVPVKRFMEAIPPNPRFRLAGFYTHATLRREDRRFQRAEELFDRWAAKGLRTFERVSEERGIDCRGLYNCMGAPNPGIEAFIKRTILREDEWEEYLREARRHPTAEDVQETKMFTRRVLSSG